MTASKTTTLKMELPDFNQSGWHTPLNENFKLLDDAIRQLVGVEGLQGKYQPATQYRAQDIVWDQEVGEFYRVKVSHVTPGADISFLEWRQTRDFWERAAIRIYINDEIDAADLLQDMIDVRDNLRNFNVSKGSVVAANQNPQVTYDPENNEVVVDLVQGDEGARFYSVSNVPTTITNSRVNDYAIQTDTGNLYKQTSLGQWTLLLSLKGAKGDKGDDGETQTTVTMLDARSFGWNTALGTPTGNKNALRAAVIAAALVGQTVWVPTPTNFVCDRVEIDNTDVRVKFEGNGVNQDPGGMFLCKANFQDIGTISAFVNETISVDGKNVEVTRLAGIDGTAGWEKGQIAKVVSDDIYAPASVTATRRRGEFAKVIAVSSGNVYVSRLEDTYVTNTRAARMSGKTFEVEGLRMQSSNSSGSTIIQIEGFYRPKVDINILDHGSIVISAVGCYGGKFYIEGRTDTRKVGGNDTLAYGGNDASGQFNEWYVVLRGARHGVTTNQGGVDPNSSNIEDYGPTRDCLITAIVDECRGSAADDHDGAVRSVFKDCVVTNAIHGFDNVTVVQSRGIDSTAINCKGDHTVKVFARYATNTRGVHKLIGCTSRSEVFIHAICGAGGYYPIIDVVGCDAAAKSSQRMIDAQSVKLRVGGVLRNLEMTTDSGQIADLDDASIFWNNPLIVMTGDGDTDSRVVRIRSDEGDQIGGGSVSGHFSLQHSTMNWDALIRSESAASKLTFSATIEDGGDIDALSGEANLSSIEDINIQNTANATGTRGQVFSVDGIVTHKGKPLFGTVAPEDFGAIGGGTANDQTAVVAAVAHAYANDLVLVLQEDYLAETTIANFHNVRKIGPGRIKTGSGFFPVEPHKLANDPFLRAPDQSDVTNVLYIDPLVGDDANDGLGDGARAVATLNQAFAILANYRSPLEGLWQIKLSGGVFDPNNQAGRKWSSTNPVWIVGATVAGAYSEPITVIDGLDNSDDGISFGYGQAVYLQNIMTTNCDNGVLASKHCLINFDNVWSEDDNYGRTVLNHTHHTNRGGAIIRAKQLGVQELFNCVRDYNRDEDNYLVIDGQGITPTGYQAKECGSGHMDYIEIKGCTQAELELQSECTANVGGMRLGGGVSASPVGILVANSEIHDWKQVTLNAVNPPVEPLKLAGSASVADLYGWQGDPSALSTGNPAAILIANQTTDASITAGANSDQEIVAAELPQGYFRMAGHKTRIEANGIIVDNGSGGATAGHLRFRPQFGASTLFNVDIPSGYQNKLFRLEMEVLITSPGVQEYWARIDVNGEAPLLAMGTATNASTGEVEIKLDVQRSSATDVFTFYNARIYG